MFVTNEVIAYYVCLVAIGIIAPVGISLFYVKKWNEKFSTVIVGAVSFFAFAICFESIPKAFLFQMAGPVSTFILTHPWVYILVGALLAGVFEETGRYIIFKTVLKRRTAKSTAIAYGLGHGLFEVMYVLGGTGAQMLSYALMIKSGAFYDIIQDAMVNAPERVAALQAIPESFAAVTFALIPVVIIERAGAVLFHVAMSIVVFASVNGPKKKWLFPLAILLHTCLDVIAGMGQLGIISNVYVFECIIAMFGVVSMITAYRLIYRNIHIND